MYFKKILFVERGVGVEIESSEKIHSLKNYSKIISSSTNILEKALH